MKVGDLVKGRHGRWRTGIILDKHVDKNVQTNDPKYKFQYKVFWTHSLLGTHVAESGWHDLEVISESG
jgi:hypothetical protein